MKNNARQELEDLFSMFHDFEITALTNHDNNLALTIQIPWGELWGDLNYFITLKLTGCDFIHCDYAEIVNTPENLSKRHVDRSSVDKSTNDQKVISELGLEVQRHNFYPPNKYEFMCNSSKNYAGGQLTFTADDYTLFNKQGIQIDLDQMKTWSNEWWTKIEND
jgi:hypothetical protein